MAEFSTATAKQYFAKLDRRIASLLCAATVAFSTSDTAAAAPIKCPPLNHIHARVGAAVIVGEVRPPKPEQNRGGPISGHAEVYYWEVTRLRVIRSQIGPIPKRFIVVSTRYDTPSGDRYGDGILVNFTISKIVLLKTVDPIATFVVGWGGGVCSNFDDQTKDRKS